MPESTGLNVRGIGWGALAILGGIVFAVIAAWLLLRNVGPAANSPPHPITAPAPRLQTAPVPERDAYFAEKQRLLVGYGWVDRRAGIARIPLDEAMRLTAGQGAQAAPNKEKR
jgi:hypothetical protein